MLQVRGPMMVKGDYSKALMKLESLAERHGRSSATFARERGAATPLFDATEPIYTAATGGTRARHGAVHSGAGESGQS